MAKEKVVETVIIDEDLEKANAEVQDALDDAIEAAKTPDGEGKPKLRIRGAKRNC